MVSYSHSRQLKNLRTEERDMQEMNPKFCQCCGMPLGEGTDMQGTNADGSKNGDYCKYCLDKGAEQAMLESFPTMKRWKK